REAVKDPPNWRTFAAHIDEGGRFRVEDVPPGKYVLEVTVNGDSDPQVRSRLTEIGLVRKTVTVPEAPAGQPDQPLDLGTITAKLFKTLKVGDRASDSRAPEPR